jgi:enoyl-CoA hydratase/carnithine racemase
MIELIHQDEIVIVRMADGKVNAMSKEFCETLTSHFDEIRRSSARAAVLTGNGGTFSAGVDLCGSSPAAAPMCANFCRR